MGRVLGRKNDSTSFSFDILEPQFLALLLDRYSPGTNLKHRAKEKKIRTLRNGDSEGEREGESCILQSQEDQDLSEDGLSITIDQLRVCRPTVRGSQ